MRRGFTLLEALFSLGLLLLLLGVFASAIQGYFRMARSSEEHSRAVLRGSEVVLKIAGEIGQSCQVQFPTAPGPADHVVFAKRDPRLSALPDPLPDPFPATWDPLAADRLVTVTYSLQNGSLVREAAWADGSRARAVVVEGMDGFGYETLSDRAFRIRLAFAGRSQLTLGTQGVFRCQ